MSESQTSAQTAPDHCAAQFGAICYRMHRGKVEVLLITSRDTGRWVVPKGWPISGLNAGETAAREAWEEAGVEGSVHSGPLGSFTYTKGRAGKSSVLCAVEVFALRVEAIKDRFPERKERQRKWFAAAKAARKVVEPDLRKLILDFARQSAALRA